MSIVRESGSIANGLKADATRGESSLSEVPEKSPDLELKPVRKRPSRKPVKPNVSVSQKEASIEEVVDKPKRRRRKRNEMKELGAEEREEGNDVEGKTKTIRRRKGGITSDNNTNGDGEDKPRKKRRRKTPEEEKIYNIPPIENVLNTTFKGRLGYACLNTMLRKFSTPIFCSRTCRLSTIAELGMDHVRSLGLQNIRDLHTLVKWNAENGIFFMRMSSEMFPFASHPEHGYDLSFADEELKAVGKTAKELGARLTSHPGQFTQLGSPREVVVRNAARDLAYHCETMDRMGLDQDSVMIIHMGGTYGDKTATLERFKENYTKLLSDSIKKRLVLENDELCYNVDDLLPICKELSIPLVFDYHHDWIHPSSRPPRELMPEMNQLWYDKVIRPKQHYSEPRPGAVSVMERRAHSDRVKMLPEGLPDDMDLMLECKDKEQAVFHIYRLYGLRDVDPRVLRPPAEVENLHTNGRKSNKRAKAKRTKAEATATEVADAEGMEVDTTVAVDGEADDAAAVRPRTTKIKARTRTKVELEREAEEHGVPPEDATVTLADSLALPDGEMGELDCGSGDEAPETEPDGAVSITKGRTRAQKKGRRKSTIDMAGAGGSGGPDVAEGADKSGFGKVSRKRKVATAPGPLKIVLPS